MTEFERKVEWAAAYDERKRGAGINGVEVSFALVGPQGAAVLLLMTNWHTAEVRAEMLAGSYPTVNGITSDGHAKYIDGRTMCMLRPLPADIGIHARTRRRETQNEHANCPYLGGDPCFYDGSTSAASFYFDVLTDKGDEALWNLLEDLYSVIFPTVVPA